MWYIKRTFALLENSNDEKVYIGIFAGIWKQKLYNHKHSFNNPLPKITQPFRNGFEI